MLERHYLDVSQAESEPALVKGLVAFAAEMDFGQVSAVVLRGDFGAPGFWGKSVGNPPEGYLEISADPENGKRDPIMKRLRASALPLVYDQRFYVDAGCGDLWERFAPFGYRTGLALGMRLGDRQLFIGVDRDSALPTSEVKRLRMMADLQLLAVHAQQAMGRLYSPPEAANEPLPQLTPREREALRWTADGHSARIAGELMSLSERGVNFHLQNAMRKLGVRSKESAVLKCLQGGLLHQG
jgi:DNA-binding CsgD family transcriptional regulator